MDDDLRFVPPDVEFEPSRTNEVARLEGGSQTDDSEEQPINGRRSPLNGYVRMLTPEGGIFILYKDQYRSLFLTIVRVSAWILVTATGGWLLFSVSSLSAEGCLLNFGLLMLISWLIVRLPIKVSHSVEIRADAMILDGKDQFYAEDIGDHWPELHMKDDDPDRMVVCGICGTRFVEFMTANRLDKNDRTPEVLVADLRAAMEQLWGRREVTFETAL